MAGDWIKIQVDTPDKPEVHYIAGVTGLDPDAVVGKLIRVWSWFDKMSRDGHADGVTYKLIDRVTGCTGFGEAMAFAGWLEQREKTLVMPNFDRHTANSAKNRALSGARQSRKRHARSVTVGTTEKRREEKISTPPLPPPGFDLFWEAWPPHFRKESKSKCAEVWKKQKLETRADEIIAHLSRLKSQWTDPQYIPAPLVFLRQARWDGADVLSFPNRFKDML